MNRFKTKDFYKDRTKEKTLVFFVLVALALIVLVISVMNPQKSIKTLTQQYVLTSPNISIINQNKVTVGDRDSALEKSDITLKPQDRLVISLEIDTNKFGYWQIIKPFNKDVVLLQETRIKDAKKNVSLSVSTEDWVFTAISIGTAKLIYEYRDLDENTNETKTEEFNIKVK